MMVIVIKNCSWILTMNEKGTILKRKSLQIDKDGTVHIIEKAPREADFVINGEGKLAMPGLINAHTHSPMSLFRGYADDLPLETWLKERIWPLERKLTPSDCRIGALLSITEMLKTGTVAFIDMYWFGEEIAKAAIKAGIRALVTYGMLDLGDPSKREKAIEGARAFIRKVRELGNPNVKPGLGPHAPYTCSKELLEEVRSLADKEKVPIHIHVAETRHEQAEFEKKYGMREVEFLDRIGFLGEDVIIAHGVWLTKQEIRRLAERGVKVVHCPVSNLKVAVGGIAPVSTMIEMGVTVCLGTDGPASNNCLDMFETMKIAALLQKHQYWDPTKVPAFEALKLATVNGEEALDQGLPGRIVDGERADIILVNINKVKFTPIHFPETIISHAVYVAKGADITDVIINGRVIVKDSKVLTLDEAEVMREATKRALRLVQS